MTAATAPSVNAPTPSATSTNAVTPPTTALRSTSLEVSIASSTAAGYESACPTAKIAVPTSRPSLRLPCTDRRQADREVDEAEHERPTRAEPVGKLAAEDAHEDDDRAEEREDEPGPVDAELARVESGERDEAAEAEEREQHEQAREEGGPRW